MTAGNDRIETFAVEDGFLVRAVEPARGEPYEHHCPRASFERVAHAIEELRAAFFTLESLAALEQLPSTQVAVTLAFLKERGIVDTRYRRNRSATGSVHLDAMTEYLALAENGRTHHDPSTLASAMSGASLRQQSRTAGHRMLSSRAFIGMGESPVRSRTAGLPVNR